MTREEALVIVKIGMQNDWAEYDGQKPNKEMVGEKEKLFKEACERLRK